MKALATASSSAEWMLAKWPPLSTHHCSECAQVRTGVASRKAPFSFVHGAEVGINVGCGVDVGAGVDDGANEGAYESVGAGVGADVGTGVGEFLKDNWQMYPDVLEHGKSFHVSPLLKPPQSSPFSPLLLGSRLDHLV
mmetsp:Transcript_50015/g.100684  ORF Transcript_50015/g.100684 Transcript_50015/m.100684 type:complete len:138 (+) Transcript_50015:55-468(+)